MYPVLLFDMDGTLVDSAEGVYQSMRYAMEAEGVPPIKREQARYFLGETWNPCSSANSAWKAQWSSGSGNASCPITRKPAFLPPPRSPAWWS